MEALAKHGPPTFDHTFLQDPYPVYRHLREAGPVLWREDVFQGAWLLTRHADVELALRDPHFSSQRTAGWIKRVPGIDIDSRGKRVRSGLDTFQRLFGRAMVFLDGADHARLRQAMAAGFHPDLIRGMRPDVERLTDELLSPLEGSASFDFIAAIARPLPSRVMGLLLGIDRKDEERFIAWSDDLATFIGALQPSAEQLLAAQRSLSNMVRYFEALLPSRRREPGADLISRLLQAEAAGTVRADGELVAQCAMLLFAGHETTRNLLGNGLHTLLSHPHQWARLCTDTSALPLALRELLRYDSPVQYTGRRIATELTLHGKTLRRGDLVLAMIGAANRDPARFADPDTFDIGRRDGSHLSFGSGPHVCIGGGLALLEADVVLRAVMRRWPGLRLAGSMRAWNDNAGLRGFANLHVEPA
ncbi:cytochrome P450 [Telluria mixta]|uniref:Cytochrome P450 n=1 Tax=Telluria mixta TaxID=34071 RepID=A0ABT2C1J5_9BURK|nr:cytochrome P450 [Telluria mixta]MCS0631258.1 cytochrome P450 [Telluria mixta]WEM95795.1 cytochrome P450 [Telluria mixta]